MNIRQLTSTWAGSIALTLLLSACGGGGGGSSSGSGTPSHSVSVRIDSAVANGESFSFQMGSDSITINQSGVATAFVTGVAEGASYTVSQTVGPRTCSFTSGNQAGTMATADVVVTADCGGASGSLTVSGTFYGPRASQVVLQNNGADDLGATVPATGVGKYDQQAFSFATPLASGTAYAVTLATEPAGQTCSVYAGGTGTVPLATGTLRVGCEYIYDKVSRSSNDSVLGSYYDSSAVVIGGASEPLGSTTAAYGEGRFVAFVSYASLDGSTGAYRQIFWRDRFTGETVLISASAAGIEGNANSYAPAISADGTTVAFESYASNLVSGDTNGVRDIFVWSAVTGTLTRASVSDTGAEANAESFDATLSGDGKIVAFTTYANNLTIGVTGTSNPNVVRRDLTSGSNVLISANIYAGNVQGNHGSGKPALSENGEKLAFWSYASDLVSGDNNGLWDIFVYTHSTEARQRVSLTSTGGERNQGTESASRIVAPAISGNGRYVAYATTATNVVPGDTNGAQDVFVVDIQTGSVVRASVDASGAQGNGDSPNGQGERPSLSYDGSWVAFSSSATNLGTSTSKILMRNIKTNETYAAPGQAGAYGPVLLSRTAAYLAFGASSALDDRFSGSGLFAHFTNKSQAFYWPTN